MHVAYSPGETTFKRQIKIGDGFNVVRLRDLPSELITVLSDPSVCNGYGECFDFIRVTTTQSAVKNNLNLRLKWATTVK
jgi:hypothetical protein